MSRDNAPVGNTCPMIDSVIDIIRTALNEAEWLLKNKNDEEAIMSEIEDSATSILNIQQAIDIMEDIRTANYELRDWGNDMHDEAESWCEKYNDVASDLEYANGKIQELEDVAH